MQNRRRFLKQTGLGFAALAGLPSTAFTAEKKPPALNAYLQRAGYYPVKLVSNESKMLFVKGSLDEQQATFLVSAGSVLTSADNKLLKGHKTLGEHGARLDDELFGLVDWNEACLVRKIRLAEAEFFNQPVLPQTLHAQERRFWQVALGQDFLLRHHATVDCRAG
jgi:hypothetical protein